MKPVRERKYHNAVVALILSAVSLLFIVLLGRTYTMRITLPQGAQSAEEFSVALGEDIVHVDSLEINREQLEIKLSALKEGKTYLDVSRNGEVYYMDSVYVHKGNVITTNTYLGNSRGAFVIPLATLIYLIYILYQLIRRYSYNRKKTLYDYANVRDLGMIIFFGSAVLMLLMTLGSAKGIDTWIRSILSSAYGLSILVLPLALIISILVTISNLE